jgi:hypothetical protein
MSCNVDHSRGQDVSGIRKKSCSWHKDRSTHGRSPFQADSGHHLEHDPIEDILHDTSCDGFAHSFYQHSNTTPSLYSASQKLEAIRNFCVPSYIPLVAGFCFFGHGCPVSGQASSFALRYAMLYGSGFAAASFTLEASRTRQ